MVDPLLIAPDNRLLGWALNDLTLYSAQPAVDVVIGPVGRDGAAVSAPGSAAGADGAPPASGEPDIAALETARLLDGEDTQPAQQSTNAPFPMIQVPIAASVAAAEPPSGPQPVGAGSLLQAPSATPLTGTLSEAVGQPATAAPPADFAVPAAAQPTTLSSAPASALVADVPVLRMDAASADDLTAPVLALAETAQIAPAAVSATLDAMPKPAQALPATGLEAADATTDAIPIDFFGGTDPAAGLTTLVGMVEGSEAFGIADGTAALEEPSQPSILDALAADAAPAPLLGEHDGGEAHPLDGIGSHVGL